MAFPLDEACGVLRKDASLPMPHASTNWDDWTNHTYLRLPQTRHAVLAGFEGTDILPFGGVLCAVESDKLDTVATLVPPFPIYPPELAYMEEPYSDKPVLQAGETGFGGRAVYLAGDIDRCYGRTLLPDLGELLASCVRWVAGPQVVEVSADAYLDCRAYRQYDRLIVHLVNLTGANQWPAYVEHRLPSGKVCISIALEGFRPRAARLTVAGGNVQPMQRDGQWLVEIHNVQGHEMVVIE